MSDSVRFACVFAAALLMSSCDWVDSVESSSPSNQSPTVSVTSVGVPLTAAPETDQPLDDSPAPLPVQAPVSLTSLEEGTVTMSAAALDVDGEIRSLRWEEAPVAGDAASACSDTVGFDPERAAPSLAAACSVSGCALTFDTVSNAAPADESIVDADSELRSDFEITMPALRSPVGVTYQLVASDDRGGTAAVPVTFCLIAVNEAPEAVDDSFSVLEGSVLDLSVDTLNLLSNDSDDVDTSNEPLRVLPDPVSPPVAASVFDLRADGGFTYAFSGTNLTSDIVDSFDYAVTDGSFTSVATATIRIVQRDDPPELDAALPALEAVEGLPFETDLASFFSDPEGADLAFDILDGDLPPSGELALSPIGELAGTPAAGDAGEYALIVAASDGTLTAEADLALSVLQNERVQADAIPDQAGRVDRLIRFGVARYFSDPEGVSLVYGLAPSGNALSLTIDTRSGVITGFATKAGSYELSVTASDGFSRLVVGTVQLVVTN